MEKTAEREMEYQEGKGVYCGRYYNFPYYFLHISYNCPSLKLYGYSTERSIRSAIKKASIKWHEAYKAAHSTS